MISEPLNPMNTLISLNGFPLKACGNDNREACGNDNREACGNDKKSNLLLSHLLALPNPKSQIKYL